MVAAEARLRVAEQQAARTLSLIGTHDPADERRLQDEQHSRMQRIQNFQIGGPQNLIGADDPRHALQENGGLPDQWYLSYVAQYWYSTKRSTPRTLKLEQSQTNRKQKSSTTSQTWTQPPEWKINHARPLASVCTAVHRNTLELQWDPPVCHGRNPEDSQKHNPGLIFSPPLLSKDAARLWTCARHLPMQQQPEETQRKVLLIAKPHVTREKNPRPTS